VAKSLADLANTGLEVSDLYSDVGFRARKSRQKNPTKQLEAMRRLARAFVESPDTILQELVNAAVDLCQAESAGISLQGKDQNGETFYRWVATAGEYQRFLNAILPSFPSACGLTIERRQPQLFRVSQRFFDLMEVDAPVVTDGILIPWEVGDTCGTIWIMSHKSEEAFDADDSRVMQLLADFAAMAIRQDQQQKKLMEQANAAAAAAMANQLAHQINNPLQSMTSALYLASLQSGANRQYLELASQQLEHLSSLVKKILALHFAAKA
jgi:transcriptional regulator with GAF, ATPase, and Fis domain